MDIMAKYRKETVIVDEPELREACLWCGSYNNGECSPCKPDIFEQAYERIE